MSYIQIEIGGKIRGLKFNQLSLEEFTKHVGTGTASAIYATFYAGLVGNCYVKQEEPDFTFEQVTEWVDQIYEGGHSEEIENVCKAWADTFVYREWLKNFQERVRAILEPEKKTKKKVK